MLSILYYFSVLVDDSFHVLYLFLFCESGNGLHSERVFAIYGLLEVCHLVPHSYLGLQLHHPFFKPSFQLHALLFDLVAQVVEVTLQTDYLLARCQVFLLETDYVAFFLLFLTEALVLLFQI